MKKICGLLLFALLPMASKAQYERILKKPDVIWAAEIDVKYYLRTLIPSDSVEQNDTSTGTTNGKGSEYTCRILRQYLQLLHNSLLLMEILATRFHFFTGESNRTIKTPSYATIPSAGNIRPMRS